MWLNRRRCQRQEGKGISRKKKGRLYFHLALKMEKEMGKVRMRKAVIPVELPCHEDRQ